MNWLLTERQAEVVAVKDNIEKAKLVVNQLSKPNA